MKEKRKSNNGVKIFAWTIVVINAVNFFVSLSFRVNAFINQYSWWIKRDYRNYLGKDQSLFNLTSSVFFEYCLFVLSYIVIMFFISTGVARNIQRYNGLRKGLVMGLFFGGALSSVLIALSMIPRFSIILQDGTAEWAFAQLPFLFLGYPSLIVGAALGVLTILIHKKTTSSKVKAQLK